MNQQKKWKSEIRLGDDVYFIDDYYGILKGVIINIMDKYKPVKYKIADQCQKIHEVLPTRVFQYEYDAKQQQRSLLRTGFSDLCNRLSISCDDALFILKMFKIEQKYSKEQLEKMLNKRVKVVVSGDTLEGILKFQKDYQDDTIWRSFYYLDEPIGDFYGSKVRQSFQIFNIEKIELI